MAGRDQPLCLTSCLVSISRRCLDRLVRNEEVSGSIPLRSANPTLTAVV
jgi:hypothetical protein